MDAGLDRLARLLPPPPGEVAAPPWERSRAEVGFDFPEDYRRFVDRYGAGYVVSDSSSTEFSIRAPQGGERRPGESGGFRGFIDKHVTEDRPLFVFDGADEGYWGGIVYPVYPDEGGVLTWGESDVGDVFFWLTEGSDPDKWPVVMWPRNLDESFRFDGGIVDFLLAVFSGLHPASPWLSGARLKWTMTSDWLRRGLEVSAGPADRTG